MVYSAMLLYVFVSTFTPGPNNLLVMFLCARNGFWGSTKFFIGAIVGFTSLFALCGILNLVLSSFVPVIEPYMKWLGAAYLLFLAFVILKGRKKTEKSDDTKMNSIVAGLLLQYMNIKGWLFGLTVFSMYVTPYSKSVITTLAFSLLFSLICMSAMFVWAISGTKLKHVFTKYETIVNVAMALLLAYCAIKVWM